jgi:CRISPR-associated endonuclease/helicase Cas3
MLLAKRTPKTPADAEPVVLGQHTEDVCDAAKALFGIAAQPTGLGEKWLRFFRLNPVTDFVAFADNLLAACLFHDWGKANHDMQTVLNGGSGGQLFRHEHLSVLLLGYEGVHDWVRQRSDIDWNVVLAAVGSHHLKFDENGFAAFRKNESVRVLLGDEDFQELVHSLIAPSLGLKGRPSFPSQAYWGFTFDTQTFDPTGIRCALKSGRLLDLDDACAETSSNRFRMLSAVRAGLIVADAAGSGLRRRGETIPDWIAARFAKIPDCTEEFIREIVLGRIRQLASSDPPTWTHELSWDSDGWNRFQKDCDHLPDRALLLAPCGAGKTLAAWRWIAGQVKQRPVKRVMFLYPTRATATEGFKDYVSWAPEADARLLHGTAGYDLDGMFSAEDPRGDKRFSDTDPRLFAIQHWSKRVFSATVDQFFAFMSYGYGPMCLLPLLADSVIVVDEVHSFDRAMFSALLGFLKTFDVPVLCMTATLQHGRKNHLIALVRKVYGAENRPGDLDQIANAPRYRVSPVDESEVEQRIRDAVVNAKQRVLWVVNQVSRAQEAHAKLTGLGVPVICYHSRFKLDHRVKRHQETVGAIRAGRPAVVAITTQVCEMSLDIDADLLVTEECPIPSLIQRMGRCNRERKPRALEISGQVLVYKPKKENVYTVEDLAGVEKFLKFVSARNEISQSDLESALDQFGSKGAEGTKLNSFLTSGPYAVSGEDSFRDMEAFNAQAVLSCDLEPYLDAGRTQKEKQPGFVVPVPRKKTVTLRTDNRLPSFLVVADDRHYDELTGFWDRPIR